MSIEILGLERGFPEGGAAELVSFAGLGIKLEWNVKEGARSR
jgi:hypothetical protein